MTTAALAKLEKATVASSSFDRFIELALTNNVPVDTLERLLAMQKEIMSANAKALYDEAMRSFQRDCPTIQKHKRVMNKDGHSVRYIYAPMDDIIEQVKKPLAEHGFSYRLGQEIDKPKPGWLTVFCTATHEAGHSETEKFEIPLGKAEYMTAQQEVGAARTFAARYCFLGVFGIMTGDEDTDANKTPEEEKKSLPPFRPHSNASGEGRKISDAQRKRFFAIAKKTGASNDVIAAWLKEKFGFEHSADITVETYDDVCSRVVEELSCA